MAGRDYSKVCADAAIELFTEELLKHQDLRQDGELHTAAGTDLRPLINALRLAAATDCYYKGIAHGTAFAQEISDPKAVEKILTELWVRLQALKKARHGEIT